MNKQIFKNIIAIVFTLLIAAGSIWLPGFLMQKNNTAELSIIKEVPADYYSGPSEAIIKNASKQLTNDQRLQLITGTWESVITPISEDACNISEFGMKNIVITRVEELRSRGLYPVSLSSDIDQWYSWSATPYRALDNVFNSYAAIFWDISFFKYDNSEYHRFIVTESGDILYAETNILPLDGFTVSTPNDASKNIPDLSKFTPTMANVSYLMYYFGEYTFTTYNTDNIRITSHNDKITSYRTSLASDKEIEKMDINSADFFITDFQPFKPDEVYSLTWISDNSNTSMNFYVCSQISDNVYRLLVIPKK